mgnify:CR=1 FL=1
MIKMFSENFVCIHLNPLGIAYPGKGAFAAIGNLNFSFERAFQQVVCRGMNHVTPLPRNLGTVLVNADRLSSPANADQLIWLR